MRTGPEVLTSAAGAVLLVAETPDSGLGLVGETLTGSTSRFEEHAALAGRGYEARELGEVECGDGGAAVYVADENADDLSEAIELIDHFTLLRVGLGQRRAEEFWEAGTAAARLLAWWVAGVLAPMRCVGGDADGFDPCNGKLAHRTPPMGVLPDHRAGAAHS